MTDADLDAVAAGHPMTPAQREAFRVVAVADPPLVGMLRAAHDFAATFPAALCGVPGTDSYFAGLVVYLAVVRALLKGAN